MLSSTSMAALEIEGIDVFVMLFPEKDLLGIP
jgi:hypothetical protein